MTTEPENSTSPTTPELETVARFQSLQAGQYWKARQAVPAEIIAEGMVLLIQSIRWVDEKPHTVILRPHPSIIGKSFRVNLSETSYTYQELKEHRFLLADFLDKFEFEPDHEAIRTKELAKIQERVTGIQNELVETQRDPEKIALIVAEGLKKDAEKAGNEAGTALVVSQVNPESVKLATGTVLAAMQSGITEATIADMKAAASREHKIATIKAGWITSKTSEIAKTIAEMTPFYEEQAAAALAQTEDVRTYVNRLVEGIASLDLYVGKDVTVNTIREGKAADPEIPLTFVQRKLLMDEELALWTDIDESFDFESMPKFFQAIQENDGLIDQIFPTERCVLVMATTRRFIDYGDTWKNMRRNAENSVVFMLVRNGQNIHQVYSPVESHLSTARLFPSKNDQNKIFQGLDGSNIKFEDVAYTDKLAAHDKFALHFKRFLLLACGLDHRLKLFGDFYEGPQSFSFVSMAFQEKYCRFIHDDDGEGLLPNPVAMPPLGKWLAEKNAFLRSGSRVLCNWFSVMNPDTAPGACKRRSHSYGFDRDYVPERTLETTIVFRAGKDLFVEVPVSSAWHRRERTFNAKVNLSAFTNSSWNNTSLAFLCLDAVSLDDLNWYLHNRKERSNHVFYIRFFKMAIRFIEIERQQESDTRRRMTQALADGKIAEGEAAADLVDRAVLAWRAANRGQSLPVFDSEGSAPAAWKSLLDQMYVLAGDVSLQSAAIAEFVRKDGREPLRLVLSGSAKFIIYTAPRDDERDDRLTPHIWVRQVTLEQTKKGFSEKSVRWISLPSHAASETTLEEWPAAANWIGLKSPFASLAQKQKLFEQIEQGRARLEELTGKADAEVFARLKAVFSNVVYEANLRSKYVATPSVTVPVGLVYNERRGAIELLNVSSSAAWGILYRLAPSQEAQNALRIKFIDQYRNKDAGLRYFTAQISGKSSWRLTRTSIDSDQSDVFQPSEINSMDLYGKPEADPLLSTWLSAFEQKYRGQESIWMAENLRNEDGSPAIDEVLGIGRPADYHPTSVYQVRLLKAKTQYREWLDMLDASMTYPDLEQGTHEGYSRSGLTVPTVAEALAHIHGHRSAGAVQVVPSVEIPDAPQPREGIRRWYVFREKEE